jgi:hypothetical protein
MEKTPESAPRTNHDYELYAAAFGEIITDAQVIADIGAGDSNFAETVEAQAANKTVWRFDAQYKDTPAAGERTVAADVRQLDMVQDDTFDASLSAFMFQHITHGHGDVALAIKEMVRITKTAEPSDKTKGNVAIYPVWGDGADLMRLLADEGLNDDNAVAIGYPTAGGLKHLDRRLNMPTLAIKKTDNLTPERVEAIAKLIESTKVLHKTETPITLGRRALMALTGRTRRNTTNNRS